MRSMPRSVCVAAVMAIGVLAIAPATMAAEEARSKQQQLMADCNKMAADKALKGDERKAFMSSCLKGEVPIAQAPKRTPQQQLMSDCNAKATEKGLKGDERKAFMSSCLKG